MWQWCATSVRGQAAQGDRAERKPRSLHTAAWGGHAPYDAHLSCEAAANQTAVPLGAGKGVGWPGGDWGQRLVGQAARHRLGGGLGAHNLNGHIRWLRGGGFCATHHPSSPIEDGQEPDRPSPSHPRGAIAALRCAALCFRLELQNPLMEEDCSRLLTLFDEVCEAGAGIHV
jgi:hypothetical protein